MTLFEVDVSDNLGLKAATQLRSSPGPSKSRQKQDRAKSGLLSQHDLQRYRSDEGRNVFIYRFLRKCRLLAEGRKQRVGGR